MSLFVVKQTRVVKQLQRVLAMKVNLADIINFSAKAVIKVAQPVA